jgi:hypothetical protein
MFEPHGKRATSSWMPKMRSLEALKVKIWLSEVQACPPSSESMAEETEKWAKVIKFSDAKAH